MAEALADFMVMSRQDPSAWQIFFVNLFFSFVLGIILALLIGALLYIILSYRSLLILFSLTLMYSLLSSQVVLTYQYYSKETGMMLIVFSQYLGGLIILIITGILLMMMNKRHLVKAQQ